MRIELFVVPYDSGMRGARMGAGPERLIESGLADRLTERGHDVNVTTIELPSGFFNSEISAAFNLDSQLADEVRAAAARDVFPIVLSGNCNSCLGTTAGIGEEELGVIWFDAHADFNTPDTTPSGFLDGMALSVLTGRCFHQMAETINGFHAFSDDSVVLVGARDLDPSEVAALETSGVTRLSAAAVATDLANAIRKLRDRSKNIYLHVDLDVLDASEGRANTYAVGGGLSVKEIEDAVRTIARDLRVRGVSLTAYDPLADVDGRAREAAMRVLLTVADTVAAM
ncbi:MAG TPA: arginase family protein [Gemmatimonadaceae bacterium]|nr:arginase family protein [Gemmatimonadaceae bacterium]